MNVLIVDDSKAMRMIVSRTLRQADHGEGNLREGAEFLVAKPFTTAQVAELLWT